MSEQREVAIEVKNITKLYKLYDKNSDRLKEALGLTKQKKYHEKLALNNIDLTVHRGETVGIIGTNGSGTTDTVTGNVHVLLKDNDINSLYHAIFKAQ